MLRVQAISDCLFEPSGVLEVPRSKATKQKATLRWRFSFWRPHGDSNPGRLREREVS